MNDTARDRFRPTIATLYGLAAVFSALLGLGSTIGLDCEACVGGVVSDALPWIGAAFYASLLVAVLRFPSAPWISHATGFYLFAHASLVGEMILHRRLCPGCLAVAALAISAAVLRGGIRSRAWLALALPLGLGGASSFLSPFQALDDVVTKRVWPAKLLAEVPLWVDREELMHCEHAAPLRLLIFEKDCKG